jgi:hypothetical protein
VRVIIWPKSVLNKYKSKKMQSDFLFSEKSNSIFIKWNNSLIKELQSVEIFDKRFILGGILSITCRFNEDKMKSLENLEIQIDEDINFFELNCFLYTYFESCMLVTGFRSEDIREIREWFIESLSQKSNVLKTDCAEPIRNIVESRLRFYKDLCSKNSSEGVILTLSTIMYKDSKLSTIFKEPNYETLVLDIEFVSFRMAVTLWHKHFMPAAKTIVDSLSNLYKKHEV